MNNRRYGQTGRKARKLPGMGKRKPRLGRGSYNRKRP